MEENFVVELCYSVEEQVKGFQQTCAQLLSRNEFVDCTLCCSDGQVQAHRIILASASSYVYNLLSTTPWPTPCSHPMLFFKTSSMEDMKLALEFIYTGKVTVSKNKLPKLMSISHDLGCTSLTKAIEKSIQSCGIELFRRRINQTQQAGIANNKPNCPNVNQNQTKSKPTHQNSFGEAHFPISSNTITEVLSYRPKSNESYESSNGNVQLDQNEIKLEPEDDDNCIEESSPSPPSSTIASQSILRSTFTPPPPLKRVMPPMTAAPIRIRTMQSNYNNNATSGNNFSYVDKEFSSNHARNGKSNGSSGGKGDTEISSMEEFGMMPSLNGDEGDEDGSVGETSHIQTDENDDEEMPITVIDLKSLAEPEVHLSETISKEDFMEMNSTEKPEVLPANCPWCFQVFTSITLLQRHIKTHVGNYKPYSCNYCPATFARSAHLKRHIRTHTGEKPFVCAICQKAFSRQDKLKTHLERHLQGQQQGGALNSTKQPSVASKILSRNPRATNGISMGQPTTSGYLQSKASRSYPNATNRLSKSLGASENQIMISTASISPSTTITPILAESNPTFTFHHQLEINNC